MAADLSVPDAFHVYDTTLRDGAQREALSLSVNDKLCIARHLDDLGVGFIEGGWPGANPKDAEFFRRAQTELSLRTAQLAAFGSTRRAGAVAADDPQVAHLRESGAGIVTLVAKSDIRHVERALKTTPAENLAMVRDTVAHLRAEGQRVFLDAEHFFDGYAADAAYAVEVLLAAAEAGADVAVMCDTNGGMLPHLLAEVVAEVGETGLRLGIHAHNDTACAVANSLAAIAAGVTHVQGTANGYGERCGNADLFSVVAALEVKLGRRVLPEGRLAELGRVSHAVAEVANIAPEPHQPWVGSSAFAHKAGLHVSAIKADPDLYQHTDPAVVGNDMRLLVSELAGRATIELKGKALGLEPDRDAVARLLTRVKELESVGYSFEAAEASFELLLREEMGQRPHYFDLESWRVIVESRAGGAPGGGSAGGAPGGGSAGGAPGGGSAGGAPGGGSAGGAPGGGSGGQVVSEATVKLHAKGERIVATGEGNGPVNALDNALREALCALYPGLARLDLVDYKVRIVSGEHGTDAVTRVLVETSDGVTEWDTVGVHENVIAASWQALEEAYTTGLLRQGQADG